MPALGLGFGHKGPLMGMLGSKRPGHRSKPSATAAATAAAAATFVRVFTQNSRVNAKRMHEVVVRQSVRYRKMFHDGTGSLKAEPEHPGHVPRAMSTSVAANTSDEKDLDWVTDGEEEETAAVTRSARPPVDIKRMQVEEVTVEAAETAADIREIILELEKELPVLEVTQIEEQVSREVEPQPEVQATQEPELKPEVQVIEESEPEPVVQAVQEPEIQLKVQPIQEPETQPEAQEISEPEPQPVVQAVRESEPQVEAQAVQQPEPQPEVQAVPDSKSQPVVPDFQESEPQPAPQAVYEPEPQSDVQAFQEPESQPQPQSVQQPVFQSEQSAAKDPDNLFESLTVREPESLPTMQSIYQRVPLPEQQTVQEPESQPLPEVKSVEESEPQQEVQAEKEPEIQLTQRPAASNHGPIVEIRDDFEDAPEPIVAAAAIEEPDTVQVNVPEPEPEPQLAKTVEDAPQESAPPLEEAAPPTPTPVNQLSESESEAPLVEEKAPEIPEPASKPPEHTLKPSVSDHNFLPLTPERAAVDENRDNDPGDVSEARGPVPAATVIQEQQVDVNPEVDEKEPPQRDSDPVIDKKVVPLATATPEVDQIEIENEAPSESGNRSRSASEVSLPPAYSTLSPPAPVDQVSLSEGKVNPNTQPTIEALKAERIATNTLRAKEVASPWMREGTRESPVSNMESEIESSERGISEEPAAVEKGEEGAMAEEYLQGKLLSTPSRLLKLVLPIPAPSPANPNPAPLALLVHPHQPLSYLERLIQTELPHKDPTNLPRVTFRALDVGASETIPGGTRKVTPAVLNKKADTAAPTHNDPHATDTQTLVRWSLSTEVGDFVRDASKGKSFTIDISHSPTSAGVLIKPIVISVPTFHDRTRYQRAELRKVTERLASLEKIKRECDALAHQAAQRVAIGGFLGLVSWWAIVYLLTFKTSYGWDVMEPVTYLAGLSTVLGGYLWFLYHNREVSYRSVLNITVTKRQMKLYEERGFDIEVWEELIDDARRLRREVRGVAAEYDVLWDEGNEVVGGDKVREVIEEKKSKLGQASKEKKVQEDDDDDDDDDSPAQLLDDKRRDKTG